MYFLFQIYDFYQIFKQSLILITLIYPDRVIVTNKDIHRNIISLLIKRLTGTKTQMKLVKLNNGVNSF